MVVVDVVVVVVVVIVVVVVVDVLLSMDQTLNKQKSAQTYIVLCGARTRAVLRRVR